MAHALKAIIGRRADIAELASHWHLARLIALPQGIAMIPLTTALLGDIEEPASSARSQRADNAHIVPAAIASVLEKATHGCSLVYIETDYFGGVGSQAAALWRNGRVSVGPLLRETSWDAQSGQHVDSGPPAINDVLAGLGVRKGWG